MNRTPAEEAVIDRVLTQRRDTLAPLAVGQIVLLSDGAYSSYGPTALVRVLRPIEDARALHRAYVNDPERVEADRLAKRYDREAWYPFVAWLVVQGYVEDLTFTEWHAEDYKKPQT